MSTGFPESRFSLSADAGEKWFSISCLVSARLGFSVTVSSSKMESSCNPILSKLPLAVDALPAVLLIIRIVALPQRVFLKDSVPRDVFALVRFNVVSTKYAVLLPPKAANAVGDIISAEVVKTDTAVNTKNAFLASPVNYPFLNITLILHLKMNCSI